MSSDSLKVDLLPGLSRKSAHKRSPHLPPLVSHYPIWNNESGHPQRSVYDCKNCGDSTFSKRRHHKVNKKGPELSVIGRSEGLMIAPSSDPLLRVTQLEQNIRFLQEQHQLMLTSLHQEVEQLRQRNRDLQFQLIFTKGGVTLVQSSPSSPEDDCRPKILLSPKQFNMTPLQVEILEREITDLKASLHEAKTKNLYLSGIVEEQKKKLEISENEKQDLAAVGRHIHPQAKSQSAAQPGPSSEDTESESLESSEDSHLVVKLEEAEKVILRLRRENEEHRKELVTIRSNLSKSMSGSSRQLGHSSSHRGGSNHHHHHRSHGSNPLQSQTHRFPPLHSQSYWHHGGQHLPHRSGNEHSSQRHNSNGSGASCSEKENHVISRAPPTLPNLRTNPSASLYSYANTNNGNGHHRRGTYYNANHYYRNGKEEGDPPGNRKYRGGRGGARGSRETKE